MQNLKDHGLDRRTPRPNRSEIGDVLYQRGPIGEFSLKQVIDRLPALNTPPVYNPKDLIMGGVYGFIDQAPSTECFVTSLDLKGIAFEGSASLGNAETVFQ